MRTLKHLLPVVAVLSITLIVTSSGYSQDREEPEGVERNRSELATFEIRNVRYLVPKGTKFPKRAGVITFEGPGEYTARRLYEMEEPLREGENELRRLESEIRNRSKLSPYADGDQSFNPLRPEQSHALAALPPVSLEDEASNTMI